MAGEFPHPAEWVTGALRRGIVIPAHPLAITSSRRLDERRQRALSRYYHAAGAGGLAIGVHTTQFAIRDPRHGLLQPVLELGARTADECDSATSRRTVLIAGVCGPTAQATGEARLARELGYHAALLSLAALTNAADEELLDHATAVAREIPLIGFYLQPAAGGRLLSHAFWRRFVEIPTVLAIKIAPFNRYQTLDVVRAVAESGRADDIALYTGNDDAIVADLISEYRFRVGDDSVRIGFAGGLLGHWACWTRRACELLDACRSARRQGTIPPALLLLGHEVTDMNAALFDAANGFHGCIPGVHEVLRRQGLLEGIWCLDEQETLGRGQGQELDRVLRAYPHLADDGFVREHVDAWLR